MSQQAPFRKVVSLVLPLFLVLGVFINAASADKQACKAYQGASCCDPKIAAHLSKESIFSACRSAAAIYLGEKGSKDTCTYMFKTGDKDSFIQVYAPTVKEVPAAPNDPFFTWTRIGKVYMTKKAKSAKSKAMIANATGLWMPGKNFYVAVNASTKVCKKPEATKLARKIR